LHIREKSITFAAKLPRPPSHLSNSSKLDCVRFGVGCRQIRKNRKIHYEQLQQHTQPISTSAIVEVSLKHTIVLEPMSVCL